MPSALPPDCCDVGRDRREAVRSQDRHLGGVGPDVLDQLAAVLADEPADEHGLCPGGLDLGASAEYDVAFGSYAVFFTMVIPSFLAAFDTLVATPAP